MQDVVRLYYVIGADAFIRNSSKKRQGFTRDSTVEKVQNYVRTK